MMIAAAYLRERLPPAVFVPGRLLWPRRRRRGRIGRRRWRVDVGLRAAPARQFRIWDDLADRDARSRRTPERVLVRRRASRPSWRVAVAGDRHHRRRRRWLGVRGCRVRGAPALDARRRPRSGLCHARSASQPSPTRSLLLEVPGVRRSSSPRSAAAPRLIRACLAGRRGRLRHARASTSAWHDAVRPAVRHPLVRLAMSDAGTSLRTVLRGCAPAICCGDRAPRAVHPARRTTSTGKPGTFQFVSCHGCGLAYQNPRVSLDHIKAYYDDEYIAHRKSELGRADAAFERAMDKLDAAKDQLVVALRRRSTPSSEVLDVGCGVGTFLQRLRDATASTVAGVDFKDLSRTRRSTASSSTAASSTKRRSRIALRSRHDVALPRARLRSAAQPAHGAARAEAGRHAGDRGAAPRQPHVPLFGDRWPGLQAPQHTVLYDASTSLRARRRAGFEVVDYLPYGAFPAYFYLFTGAAFRLLKGRGLNLQARHRPVLRRPAADSRRSSLFERHLNLAMQTVVCRRPP